MIGLWNAAMVTWLELSWMNRMALWAWIGDLVLLPVLVWIWDDKALRWGVTTGVVLQAVAVFVALGSLWGWQRASAVGLAIAGMGWAADGGCCTA